MTSKEKMAKFAEIAKKNIDNNSMSIVISIKDGGETYETDTVIIIDESLGMNKKLAMGIAMQKAMITSVLHPIATGGGNADDMINHLVMLAKDHIVKADRATTENTTVH